MPLYQLDTNSLLDLVRHPQGRIATCIAQVGEKSVCTSMIVASESTLVTANTGEFSRVPGLTVENWLEAMPKR